MAPTSEEGRAPPPRRASVTTAKEVHFMPSVYQMLAGCRSSGILPTMAYVVVRSDGRFEIRESVSTSAGPRSRTLATFRSLSDEVLVHAEARATRPFDRAGVVARARAHGVPETPPEPVVRLAWRLLTELGSGQHLPEVFAEALRGELGSQKAPLPDTIPPLVEWLGATPRERGDTLRDLLRMTDRLPPRRTPAGRRYPRIASSRA